MIIAEKKPSGTVFVDVYGNSDDVFDEMVGMLIHFKSDKRFDLLFTCALMALKNDEVEAEEVSPEEMA